MADDTQDVVYRTRYEQVDASAVRPRAATERRRQEEINRAEANKAAPDSSQAEAGPYGPNADYETVDAPNDRDHTSPAQPKE